MLLRTILKLAPQVLVILYLEFYCLLYKQCFATTEKKQNYKERKMIN